MTSTPEQVIAKIREALEGDHERLCQGREYTCTCGHDDVVHQALTAALQSAADTRVPPPPQTQTDGLPQDVINLVIAAREAFDTGMLPSDENNALDEALEAFAGRVRYENEPTGQTCPHCKGLGAFPETGMDCGECHGGGEVEAND